MKRDNNIPKFNLAEQIMVEQRKVSSVKRIAPKSTNKKPKVSKMENIAKTIIETVPVHSNASHNGEPKPAEAKQQTVSNPEQIISEIVAKDIKQLRNKRI